MPSPKVTLLRLKRQLKRLQITQDRVATEAGVTRPLVVNVLAGRSTSSRVVDAAKRLIQRAKPRMSDADDAVISKAKATSTKAGTLQEQSDAIRDSSRAIVHDARRLRAVAATVREGRVR